MDQLATKKATYIKIQHCLGLPQRKENNEYSRNSEKEENRNVVLFVDFPNIESLTCACYAP